MVKLISGYWLFLGAHAASGQGTFAVAQPLVAPPTHVDLTAVSDWQPTLRTVPVAAPRIAGAQAKLVALKDSLARLQRAANSPSLPISSARTAAAPQVLGSFFGYELPGTPNDDDLAVANDGTVVSVMNGRIALHAEDGTLLRTQNLAALTATPGVRGFDPHVLYDPEVDRFVVVFLSGNVAAASVVHVAVSASADPQGAWHSYQLSGSPLNDGTWMDYPSILLTREDLFISGNTFTDGSTNNSGFRQSTIWQLSKQKLLAGQALQSGDVRYYHNITANGQPVFNLTPVRGSTGLGPLPAYFLSSDALSAQNSQRLLLVRIGAALSATPDLEVRACAGMLPYTLPPDVRQLGSSLTLGRNDARVMSAFQHNQRIHFVLNVLQTAGSPRAGVCYGQIINLTAPTPSAQAQVLPEGREAAFPAIAYCGRTPAENSALIVYSHASPTEHVGYSAVFVDDTGDLSVPISLHTGDDYLAIWGDYLGLSPRYNHPGEVWAQGCVPVTTGLGGGGERRPHISRLAHPGVVTATRPAEVRPPLVAYPNPATDYVSVEFQQGRGGHTRISLLDPRGQTVAELLHDWVRAGRTTLRFATASLPAGLYVVRVESQHERPQTHRLVVLKP
ncbi:T9SS type A sorting domain-containing protein [Hymenobacter sp. YC55]|uniref:T9SS type A sorting domain-containing protein n=1 Tax=Hymenobacter sp. YC55 TaxID=3034019 RepID=UPI0023F8CED4|nr:T9SS type A sorting domain-containing protein [Hymenobacter sp. YC55]MDF7815041.1 T9SS type A sorting domain-containing protein [Hymenobacter sp. YC55]